MPVAVERVWDNLITLKRKLKWERSETTDLMHAAMNDKVGKAQKQQQLKQHVIVEQNYSATRLSEFSHSPGIPCFIGTSTGVEIRWLNFFLCVFGLQPHMDLCF